MTHRSVVTSTFEAFLEFDLADSSTVADRESQVSHRNELLQRFPFAVMLELAFPELDFANRLCWNEFGPANGECLQMHSEYPACPRKDPHDHTGTWETHWFVKTDYNFGFNEWYFAEKSLRDRFLQCVDLINWGEHYLQK